MQQTSPVDETLAGNFDGKVNTVTISVGWLFSLVK